MTSNPGKQLVPQEWSSQDLCLPLGSPLPSSSPFQQGGHIFMPLPGKRGLAHSAPGLSSTLGPLRALFTC